MMELSAKSFFNSIKTYAKELWEPLDDQLSETNIMPLWQVEHILHEHYISQETLQLTFEYYNRANRIEERTLEVAVRSAITTNRCIVLHDLSRNCPLILSTEQILYVNSQPKQPLDLRIKRSFCHYLMLSQTA